jgi:hypothetical protein
MKQTNLRVRRAFQDIFGRLRNRMKRSSHDIFSFLAWMASHCQRCQPFSEAFSFSKQPDFVIGIG